MAGSEPVVTPGSRYGDLLPRILVGIALIALALGAVWLGGIAFALLAVVVVLLIYAEWCAMHRVGRAVRMVGMFALAGAVLFTHLDYAAYALMLVGIAAAVLFFLASIAAWGLLYAALPGIALVWLRAEPLGAQLVIWTLVIVWATDIAAYFSGRTIGGPKIAPRISPSKTWAGLGGGMIAAALAAWLLARQFGLDLNPVFAAALGALLAVAAQVGDFFESHLKRRAGVKDSGNILPGHGGVMDRLDGVMPVSVLVAIAIGLTR
ncbi:phosphatidate cytidylyltransferase [Sphingosinicella soli]|uniref:Phosphatidate cytidylyltransferase n=1 Tax=Sphingosinicella soli TaxID=333708 RepID=A0A7W7F5I6_9SPHN|nr:phosphatidate cytidylyltransferase [Sphingosinicella soli]MBB4630577.1 phosphatidate cytidylyltransferase [Sphingosinicella soli]